MKKDTLFSLSRWSNSVVAKETNDVHKIRPFGQFMLLFFFPPFSSSILLPFLPSSLLLNLSISFPLRICPFLFRTLSRRWREGFRRPASRSGSSSPEILRSTTIRYSAAAECWTLDVTMIWSCLLTTLLYRETGAVCWEILIGPLAEPLTLIITGVAAE